MAAILSYFQANGPRFCGMLGAHIRVSILALVIAVLIGVPAGFLCVLHPRSQKAITGLFSVLRVIPSLAILLLMVPLLGTGTALTRIAALLLTLNLSGCQNETDTSKQELPVKTTAISDQNQGDETMYGYDFSAFQNVTISGIDLKKLSEEELSVLYTQARYCQAMTDADIDTMRKIVSEDMVFTHMSGRTQTREEYFADSARERLVSPARYTHSFPEANEYFTCLPTPCLSGRSWM